MKIQNALVECNGPNVMTPEENDFIPACRPLMRGSKF